MNISQNSWIFLHGFGGQLYNVFSLSRSVWNEKVILSKMKYIYDVFGFTSLNLVLCPISAPSTRTKMVGIEESIAKP